MKLSEETKKLFNAPWQVKTYDCFRLGYEYCVETPNGDTISISKDENPDAEKHAKRIKHLPELYDALKEAVYDCCEDCLCALDEFNDGEYECDENGCVKYDLIEKGCVFKERDCCPKCRSWIDILRKVRDGK
jgi:hypothetical protein